MAKAWVTAILPKKKLGTARETARAIEKVLDDQAQEALELFEKTTAAWDKPPAFVVKKTSFGRSVYTTNPIYTYVDKGTRWHAIRPKRGRVLAFNAGGFRAKTRPGVLTSSGGSRGKTRVFSRLVMHPGSAPRGFSKKIQERMQKQFPAALRKKIKQLYG